MSPATQSAHDLPNGSIDYRASTHDALSQVQGRYLPLFEGRDLGLAAVHIKKHATFQIGTSGSQYVCFVVSGRSKIHTPHDEVARDQSDDEDEDEDEDEKDDENEQGSDTKRARQATRSRAVREGDVVVVSGVSEIRTRGHGIRMLVVAHIRHSLLPMAV
jgi:hypothetical protein